MCIEEFKAFMSMHHMQKLVDEYNADHNWSQFKCVMFRLIAVGVQLETNKMLTYLPTRGN